MLLGPISNNFYIRCIQRINFRRRQHNRLLLLKCKMSLQDKWKIRHFWSLAASSDPQRSLKWPKIASYLLKDQVIYLSVRLISRSPAACLYCDCVSLLCHVDLEYYSRSGFRLVDIVFCIQLETAKQQQDLLTRKSQTMGNRNRKSDIQKLTYKLQMRGGYNLLWTSSIRSHLAKTHLDQSRSCSFGLYVHKSRIRRHLR